MIHMFGIGLWDMSNFKWFQVTKNSVFNGFLWCIQVALITRPKLAHY